MISDLYAMGGEDDENMLALNLTNELTTPQFACVP